MLAWSNLFPGDFYVKMFQFLGNKHLLIYLWYCEELYWTALRYTHLSTLFPATRPQPLVDQQHADGGDQVARLGGCGLEVHLHNPIAN